MIRRILIVCALAAACGSSGGSTPPPPDGGPDGGSVTDAGSWTATPDVVESNTDAGYDLFATVDTSGHPAVAYFRKDDNVFDPTCPADGGCPSYALVVARETSEGSWSSEVVPASIDGGTLTGHYGVTLAFDPNGNPAVAYLGGEASKDDPTYSDNRWHDLLTGAFLPSDFMIARKSGGTWTRTRLARSSDSLVTDAAIVGTSLDDSGPVTGLWSAVTFASDGSVHGITRDCHYGNDNSAFDASNLEYAHFSSGLAELTGEIVASRIYPLTPASQQIHGGGNYTRLVLAADGQPAVSFSLSGGGTGSPDGSNQVWFAKRTGANAWTRTMVSGVTGRVGMGPSLAYSTAQGFALGFIDGAQADLLVATSSDGLTWSSANTVEALGETGYHPAVAFNGANLGALYGYCHDPVYSGTSPCDPVAQQLRFREAGSGGPLGAWNSPEVLSARVPTQTALVVDGNGKWVAIWLDPQLGLVAARRNIP